MNEILAHSNLPNSTNALTCERCCINLPLRKRSQGETTMIWLCAGCHVPMIAVGLKESLITHGHLVNLDDRYFDTRSKFDGGLDLKLQLERFGIVTSSKNTHDRRRSARDHQSRIVSGIVLNEHLLPNGLPEEMFLLDLSCDGLGLIVQNHIEFPYLALELSAKEDYRFQVIVKIVHQQTINSRFHKIGGEFLVKLGSSARES